MYNLTHLKELEAESIHIMREMIAEFENPAMLYSIGKDSSVMLHLAQKAFYPAPPPFPLVHVDTKWKFKEMIEFRDKRALEVGMELIVYSNPEGDKLNISPFTHGSSMHTDIMKTEALKQMLELYKFDAVFGGARRDEEKSRAKERIYSFRDENHRWNPKNQRPELWNIYNGRHKKNESIRVSQINTAEILRKKLLAAFDNGKIRVIPREDPSGNRLDLRRDIGFHYLAAEQIFPD